MKQEYYIIRGREDGRFYDSGVAMDNNRNCCCGYISHKKDDEPQNCMTEGMCIGMCLGVAIGSTGLISLALGISSGMLIGEVIGFIIKK